MSNNEGVRRLEKEIEELRGHWPAHTVREWQWEQLEDLEEKFDGLVGSRLRVPLDQITKGKSPVSEMDWMLEELKGMEGETEVRGSS